MPSTVSCLRKAKAPALLTSTSMRPYSAASRPARPRTSDKRGQVCDLETNPGVACPEAKAIPGRRAPGRIPSHAHDRRAPLCEDPRQARSRSLTWLPLPRTCCLFVMVRLPPRPRRPQQPGPLPCGRHRFAGPLHPRQPPAQSRTVFPTCARSPACTGRAGQSRSPRTAPCSRSRARSPRGPQPCRRGLPAPPRRDRRR